MKRDQSEDEKHGEMNEIHEMHVRNEMMKTRLEKKKEDVEKDTTMFSRMSEWNEWTRNWPDGSP